MMYHEPGIRRRRTSTRLTVLHDALQPLAVTARQLERDLPEGRSRDVAEQTALDVERSLRRLRDEMAVLLRVGS